MAINALDQKLIGLLEKDARQSSGALAKQLNISSSAIRRRIKKLVDDGVIRIVAQAEPTKAGFPLRAVISFDVAHNKLESVMQILASKPEVKWLSATSGRFDIIALAWFTSNDDLYNFIEHEVGGLEGIKDTETFVCLHVRKSSGFSDSD